jgi:hypothetical protein
LFKRDGSEWKWTDGTQMNQTLRSVLWVPGHPRGDGKRMEIIKRWGLNDLSQHLKRGDMFSYVCTIPCSEGKNSG